MGRNSSRRLVIRPGAIGDCIVSLPAIEAVCPDEVWVAPANVPLVRFARRVRSIQSTGLDLLGLPATTAPDSLMAALRGFDLIFSWYGANRREFRDAVAALGLPFYFFPALPPVGAREHAADFYARQVSEFASCAIPAVPNLPCPASPRPTAVIHPFSGSPRKNWPLKYFQELAAALPLPVEWCAGPEESLDAAAAVRFEDLYALGCWLAGARLYIGNDSGISHLAAAVGAPVVALFGPTDPAVWAPRGPLVRVLGSGDGSVESIDLSRVLDAAKELLARSEATRAMC